MTRVGIFRLEDPPAAGEQIVRDTIAAIDYPWQRILPAVRDDPDGAVVIRWDPKMGQGTTGLFYGHTYTIVLSTRYDSWERGAPFVLAHEIGHLVDRATLDRDTRQAILDLWHGDLDAGPWNGVEDPNNPGEPHEWSHESPHRETWVNGADTYYLRPNEAYADGFVEAFAPDLFATRGRRFAHATDNLEELRRLTLGREIDVFDDVPDDHLFAADIEDLAGIGVVGGYPDGTFRPDEPVTRQAVAAFLARTLDHVAPGWRPTV